MQELSTSYVSISSEDAPQQLAAWTRGDRPFDVVVRNPSQSISALVGTMADHDAGGGILVSGYTGDLVIHVPAADRGEVPTEEKLYGWRLTSGQTYVSTLIQPR